MSRTKVIPLAELGPHDHVAGSPFNDFGVDSCVIYDYAPRPEDYAWVARELGDVPYRGRSYEETMQLAFASTVSVESLGRSEP